jgi:hypothetical protein
MPVPVPNTPDPGHIEMRLLVVAEMLENAVAEIRHTMAEIKGDVYAEAEQRRSGEVQE